MPRQLPAPAVSTAQKSNLRRNASLRFARPLFLSGIFATAILLNGSLDAQTSGQIAASTGGTAEVTTLADQHPQWANPANDAGLLPADRTLDNITLVLARSPQQEAAFQQFLADQQSPPRPTITTGSRRPRLRSASGRRTLRPQPSPNGCNRRACTSAGSPPAAPSSASAAQPRKSAAHSRPSCTPTESTASSACPSPRTQYSP